MKINKKNFGIGFIVISSLATLFSCAPKEEFYSKYNYATVVIENGNNYSVEDNYRKVIPGSDVSFKIYLLSGSEITDVSYDKYSLETFDNYCILNLKEIFYSTIVKLIVEKDLITYHINGGTRYDNTDPSLPINKPYSAKHLSTNTLLGHDLAYKDGYVLNGWNTKEDLSGEHIGIGSRVLPSEKLNLYAEWKKETDYNLFEYEKKDNKIKINKLKESVNELVIPRKIEGISVEEISSNAFVDKSFYAVILPDTIRKLSSLSFVNCNIDNLFFYDNISFFAEDAILEDTKIKRVHINAYLAPTFSGSYLDAFTDKIDWLKKNESNKKIIMFSGSSARYGYDSLRFLEAFPQYIPVNMGVFAYTNALPQLEIIRTFTRKEDILLCAPEFDAVNNQFCVSNSLDYRLFGMVESNYDILSLLNLSDFSGFSKAFHDYVIQKKLMTPLSYGICANEFDDDKNPVSYKTYNIYGDYILERPNSEKDEMHRVIRTDYTLDSFSKDTLKSYEKELNKFLVSGVEVLFTYVSINRSSLTEKSTLSRRQELEKFISDNLNIPIISRMENYMESGIYFYVIDNHLSDEGVQIRMNKIIADINNYYKN